MATRNLAGDNEVALATETTIVSPLTADVRVSLPVIGGGAGQAAEGTTFTISCASSGRVTALDSAGRIIGTVPPRGSEAFAAVDAGAQEWSIVAPAGGVTEPLVLTSDATINGVRIGKGNGGTGFSVSNTCVGTGALAVAVDNSAEDETAVGNDALAALTDGYGNTAVGARAGGAITTGSQNVAVGADSLEAVTTGNDNTAVGYGAMNSDGPAANRNTAVGKDALAFASGNDNAAVGYRSGHTASGDGNTLIGSGAGDSITTGSRNIVIGKGADTSAAGANDELVIGDATFEAAALAAVADAAANRKLKIKIGGTVIYLLATTVAG